MKRTDEKKVLSIFEKMTTPPVSKAILFHRDLKIIKEKVYDRCGYHITNFKRNAEGEEYDACSFELNGKKVQYRFSKVTPTKSGQFVTIWKRNQAGITAPFDVSDDIDFVLITSRSGERIGQFVFPKNVLIERGVLTANGKEGKRGVRVYPPWDNPTNKQAEKTQRWQSQYFLTIEGDDTTNLDLMRKLLG